MAFLIKNMQYNDKVIVYINGNLTPLNKLVDTSYLTLQAKMLYNSSYQFKVFLLNRFNYRLSYD